MSFRDIVDTINRIYNNDNTKIKDNLFLIFIIILFITIFILNTSELLSFLISRYNMVSEPVMTKSPYNDSLYKRYCDLYETNNLVIDWQIMTWFVIYLVLFIIFWFNYLVDALSYIRIEKEIKLLIYSKYYNDDLTNESEYNFLKYLSRYILAMLIILSYYTYNYYNNYNNVDTEVYGNMKSINEEFGNYIIPELYTILIKEDGLPLKDKLKKYHNEIVNLPPGKEKMDVLFGVGKGDEAVEQRLKLMITYIVSYDSRFGMVRIKSKPNEPTTDFIPDTHKCFYSLLTNYKQDALLPEYEDVENKFLFIEPYDYANDAVLNIEVDARKIEGSKLREKYNDIKNKLANYSRNINNYHDDNTIYYKIWLLFITMSGFLVSIFTLIFFGIETGWFSTTFEEWFFNNYKTLIFVITLFVLIIGSMIINL